jgi:hypothetical protein
MFYLEEAVTGPIEVGGQYTLVVKEGTFDRACGKGKRTVLLSASYSETLKKRIFLKQKPPV